MTLRVPDQLLECEPEPPAEQPGTQKDVAVYILELRNAGQSCRDAIGEIKRWIGAKTSSVKAVED